LKAIGLLKMKIGKLITFGNFVKVAVVVFAGAKIPGLLKFIES
jgi:hypothetical protein